MQTRKCLASPNPAAIRLRNEVQFASRYVLALWQARLDSHRFHLYSAPFDAVAEIECEEVSTRLAKRWTPQDLTAFHKFHRDIKEDVMRRAARTDNNQHELIEALKKIGARCYYIKEPVDLVVGFRGRNILLECKAPGKHLTQAQEEFIKTWPGEVAICHDITEAISAVVHGAKP